MKKTNEVTIPWTRQQERKKKEEEHEKEKRDTRRCASASRLIGLKTFQV